MSSIPGTLHESPWRAMWQLTIPVLAQESLTMLVGYTDWWLAGHYLGTTEHLAAMALLVYVLWLVSSLFSGVAIGATALVARFIGAGNTAMASQVVNQAMLLGLILSLAVTLATALLGPTFIGWMQLRGNAASLVWQYVQIIIPCIPFIMVEQVAAACLRGAGDTVSGLIAKSIVNVVNVIVSPLLLLGLGPVPELGWRGIAVGTAAGHALGGTLLLWMLIRGRAGLGISLSGMKPNRDLIRRLVRIGWPGGLDIGAVVFCHLVYVSIINRLGTAAAAAHGLGLQIEALSYLPGAAFQVAATTLSGQYLGAGQPKRASSSILLTCVAGCSVMSCAAVAYLFAGEWLAAIFTGDRSDPTVQQAGRLLKIVALSTPSLGILAIMTGGLRGAGDTRFPLLVTFVGLLGIRIPLACLLSWNMVTFPGTTLTIEGYGLGVEGAWWAMTTDVILRSILISLRFFHGGWRHLKV